MDEIRVILDWMQMLLDNEIHILLRSFFPFNLAHNAAFVAQKVAEISKHERYFELPEILIKQLFLGGRSRWQMNNLTLDIDLIQTKELFLLCGRVESCI